MVGPNIEIIRIGHRFDNIKTHKIVMDVSSFSADYVSLYHTLTQMWLQHNCKNPWYIEAQLEKGEYMSRYLTITIKFREAQDAMLFKLSSQFGMANSHTTMAPFSIN